MALSHLIPPRHNSRTHRQEGGKQVKNSSGRANYALSFTFFLVTFPPVPGNQRSENHCRRCSPSPVSLLTLPHLPTSSNIVKKFVERTG